MLSPSPINQLFSQTTKSITHETQCHLHFNSQWPHRMNLTSCQFCNYYYYIHSGVESKKLQEHSRKNKTNDSVTQVKNRSQTVRDQTSSWRAVSSANDDDRILHAQSKAKKMQQQCCTWTVLLHATRSLAGTQCSTQRCEELCSTSCVSARTAKSAPATGQILLHRTNKQFYQPPYMWMQLPGHLHDFLSVFVAELHTSVYRKIYMKATCLTHHKRLLMQNFSTVRLSSGTLRSAIEYGLPLPSPLHYQRNNEVYLHQQPSTGTV